MKIHPKNRSRIFVLALLLFLLPLFSSCHAERTDGGRVSLSPALDILAEQGGIALCGRVGRELTLEAEDFARALHLSRVDRITVTVPPPVTDGELLLGSTVVTADTTVRFTGATSLCYTPRDGITQSSFRFLVNDAPYELSCTLYFLPAHNYAPTLSAVPATDLAVSTHRNVTLFGTLPCYDPDGDDTSVEIVAYPEHGLLLLTDPSDGSYTYVPSRDYTGKDSFRYVARDRYGNYSPSATVTVEIVKPSSSAVYHDAIGKPFYHAVLSVTEAGVMQGTRVGEREYFYPDRTVSRAEFCVMAMRTLGITEVAESTGGVFSDENDIPSEAKNYVNAAYELGYVRGLTLDGALCFEPLRPITRAEAAVMLSRMLDADMPTVSPVFADADQIPTWASSSLASMAALGILKTDGGYVDAAEAVTRADAAELLYGLMRTVKRSE